MHILDCADRPDRLNRSLDVVDPENVGTAEKALDETRDRAGVAAGGVGEGEDVADDGLAGDGQEDGALEAVEAGEFAVDAEVVVALLGEVDAGVEHDGFAREAGGFGQGNFLLEEYPRGARGHRRSRCGYEGLSARRRSA